MARTGHLSARIEPNLKVQAERILRVLGLSTSDAIGLFYRQVVLRRGLPFDVCIPNAATLAALEEAEAGGGEVITGDTAAAFDEITS